MNFAPDKKLRDPVTEKLIDMLRPRPKTPLLLPTMSPAEKAAIDAHRAWARRRYGRTW